MSSYFLIFLGVLGVIAGLLLGTLSNWLYDILKRMGIFQDNPTLKRIVVIIAVFLPLIFVVVLSQTLKTPNTPPGEWTKIMEPSIHWLGVCGAYNAVIPEYLDPKQDANAALELINRYSNYEVNPDKISAEWSKSTPVAGFESEFTFTNIVEGNKWVEISNTIYASIDVKQAPEHMNVFTVPPGCGGGKQVRTFEVPLQFTSENKYKITSTNSDFGNYSLEPGEYEHFAVDFLCKSPGSYKVELSIPYIYSGELDQIVIESPLEFICPNTFTDWNASGPVNDLKLSYIEFIWDGKSYSEKE